MVARVRWRAYSGACYVARIMWRALCGVRKVERVMWRAIGGARQGMTIKQDVIFTSLARVVPLIKLTASASMMTMTGNDRMKNCVSEIMKKNTLKGKR